MPLECHCQQVQQEGMLRLSLDAANPPPQQQLGITSTSEGEGAMEIPQSHDSLEVGRMSQIDPGSAPTIPLCYSK